MIRRFAQVDVFGAQPVRGNAVAVVLDAEDLSDGDMAAFARWTNLSETTYVLPPTDPSADYQLRIFTPGGELPFAGHPTLGSAHAWLEAGGRPRGTGLVQECAAGLVGLRRDGARLFFAAPPRSRTGPVDDATRAEVTAALGLAPDEVLAAEWVAVGPQWMALRLASAERVLELTPDAAALGDHEVGVVGPYADGHPDDPAVALEVRAFAPGDGVPEDPVTGSLNAGLAQWLRAEDLVGPSYVAAQGTAMRRAGRVHVVDDGEQIWVGGVSDTVVAGTVNL